MAVTTFLKSILEEGVRDRWFSIEKIGRLKQSCCLSATTEVVDFDAFKDRFHKGGQLPASCDGMKILPEHGRIDFIEMKGLKIFINRAISGTGKLDSDLEAQITDFNFPKKVVDSLASLSIWMKSNGLAETGNLDEVPKRFIILTDIDPAENAVQFISLNFEFFAQFGESVEARVHRFFENRIGQLSEMHIQNLGRPILKTCSEIDGYYAPI